MKKLIMIAGVVIAAILISKSAKATGQTTEQPPQQPPIQITPGKIINIETNIIGNCAGNNCLINKDLLIYSTFKNIGSFTKTNQIGIQIDNTIVKSEYITLNPNQEYSIIYNTQLDIEKSYNICGIITQ